LFGWNVRLLTGTPGLRETVLNQMTDMPCAVGALCAQDMSAPDMGQPVNGTGDLGTGQTKPLRG
jgi:hypothetical protein